MRDGGDYTVNTFLEVLSLSWTLPSFSPSKREERRKEKRERKEMFQVLRKVIFIIV